MFGIRASIPMFAAAVDHSSLREPGMLAGGDRGHHPPAGDQRDHCGDRDHDLRIHAGQLNTRPILMLQRRRVPEALMKRDSRRHQNDRGHHGRSRRPLAAHEYIGLYTAYPLTTAGFQRASHL